MKFLLIFFFFISAANAANPEFVTVTFDGKNFDLSKEKGKVVIVNLWAKWCSDCRKEMPVLDEIYKEYKSRGLEIIGVSVDPKSEREATKNFAARFSYTNSMMIDADKITFEDPDFIPMNYIVDKNGNVVAILNKAGLEKRDFENVIKPLLSK